MEVAEKIFSVSPSKGNVLNETSKEFLLEAIKSLKKRESEIKEDLHEYVKKYNTEVMVSKGEVQRFKEQLSEVTTSFSRLQDKVIPLFSNEELHRVNTEYKSVLELLNAVEVEINLTAHICKIQEKLLTFDANYYEHQNYLDASLDLREADCLLKNVQHESPSRHAPIEALTAEFLERENIFSAFLRTEWAQRFEWVYPESQAGDTEGAQKVFFSAERLRSGAASRDGDPTSLCSLLTMMKRSNSHSHTLKSFASAFYSCFFDPLLRQPSFKLSVDYDHLKLRLELSSGSSFALGSLLKDAQSLFAFLTLIFSPSSTSADADVERTASQVFSEVRQRIGASLIGKMSSGFGELLENFSDTGIPSSEWTSISEDIGVLEHYLLENGYILKAETGLLALFEAKVAHQRSHENTWILERARRIMLSKDEATITLEDSKFEDICQLQGVFDRIKTSDVSIEQVTKTSEKWSNMAMIEPLFFMHKCAVHSSVKALVEFISATRDELLSSMDSSKSRQVFDSCRDILEMFLAVVSVKSRECENNIKEIALLHNDCHFLANHCSVLAFSFAAPSEDATTLYSFVDYSLLLRQLGDDLLHQELRQRTSAALDILKDLHNMLRSSRYNPSASLQIFNKIHRFLYCIRQQCLKVLPAAVYQSLMSSVLSNVYESVYNLVVAREDITSNEAYHMESTLPLLLENVVALISTSDDATDVSAEKYYDSVPFLQRFQFLILILKSTMQEIVDMWEDRQNPLSAVFPTNDLVNLIRSLFQNTKHRADAISRIKNRLH